MDSFPWMVRREEQIIFAVWLSDSGRHSSEIARRQRAWGMNSEPQGGDTAGQTDRVGIRSLRHFVSSKLLANGVDMMVVSRILDHESIKTTVDIFRHLQDSLRTQ